MAWYKDWFGEEYLELYAHRDAGEADRHVDFVVEHVGGAPRAVLDLACGAGRHTCQQNISLKKIDLSRLVAYPSSLLHLLS